MELLQRIDGDDGHADERESGARRERAGISGRKVQVRAGASSACSGGVLITVDSRSLPKSLWHAWDPSQARGSRLRRFHSRRAGGITITSRAAQVIVQYMRFLGRRDRAHRRCTRDSGRLWSVSLEAVLRPAAPRDTAVPLRCVRLPRGAFVPWARKCLSAERVTWSALHRIRRAPQRAGTVDVRASHRLGCIRRRIQFCDYR